MKRDLSPAFTGPGQATFKVLKLLLASRVWWDWNIQCAQRTHTRPKALSTCNILWISTKHMQKLAFDISTILNMHRMLLSMFICSV